MNLLWKQLLYGLFVPVLGLGTCVGVAGCSTSIKAIAESNVGPFHSSAWVEGHESRPFSFTLDVANDPWSSSVTYGPVTVGSTIGLSGTGNKLAALTMALAPMVAEPAP